MKNRGEEGLWKKCMLDEVQFYLLHDHQVVMYEESLIQWFVLIMFIFLKF